MNIINPATEELITTLKEDNIESLSGKFKVLNTGRDSWSGLPRTERIDILKKFSGLLSDKKEALAKILSDEVGKPVSQAINEIKGAVSRISWLTDNGEKYLSDEWMKKEEGLGERISYEPLGVICNISAWNYPYLVGVNVFVPALFSGNAVMYKPSEYATLTGLQIQELLYQAGVPEEVFQVAVGGAQVGEILLNTPYDGYFFTGSYKTGKYIYEKVASRMVPCQLELGGKDPLYVADDIEDIKKVVAGTADGAFYNNGQSCCSVERIYVHERIYDEYVNEFEKEVKSYKLGLPAEDGVYLGPLTRKDQISVLEVQVADAIAKGARLLTGGKRVNSKGYYFEPTVITEVSHEMKLMKEESFGPVIGIMKVRNDEEAVKLMNDTEYGLTASVYTNDRTRAEKILSKLNSGTAYWNCCDRVSAALPWGGRKHSGIGATLSHAGIRAFVRPKAYHLAGNPG